MPSEQDYVKNWYGAKRLKESPDDKGGIGGSGIDTGDVAKYGGQLGDIALGAVQGHLAQKREDQRRKEDMKWAAQTATGDAAGSFADKEQAALGMMFHIGRGR